MISFHHGNQKGLSGESFKVPAASNSLAPSLNYIGPKIRVKFDGSCLKQDKKNWHLLIKG